MSEEKPLHVQVAEALGWKDTLGPVGDIWGDIWLGTTPSPNEGDSEAIGYLIPHYDTDWSATGPLIEKYRIQIHSEFSDEDGSWQADTPMDGLVAEGEGHTPLIAVCHLILALHHEGKLA